MANWFEDLTKSIADDKLPRRQAMRRIVGTIAGLGLTSWIPKEVWAKDIPKGKPVCLPSHPCNGTAPNCPNPNNYNCFCFTTIKGTTGDCGCNTFCSGLPTCNSPHDCPKGSFCSINNGCTGCGGPPGVCLPKCSATCHLGKGEGATAARR